MDHELRCEAVAFSRYLVGAAPSDALVDRYVQANHVLFAAAPPAADDAALIAFARRHAWAIPLFDASMAVTKPGSLLRKKLLVMMAILETAPEFAARTSPRAVGVPRLVLGGAAAGATAALNFVGGLALAAAVRAGGRRGG